MHAWQVTGGIALRALRRTLVLALKTYQQLLALPYKHTPLYLPFVSAFLRSACW
jgi:hypothetical protein